MKILTVTLNYPPTRYIGAENYHHVLNQYLQKQGHTVHNVTTEHQQSYTHEGIQVNPTGEEYGGYDLIIAPLNHYDHAVFQRNSLKLSNQTPIVGVQHNTSNVTNKIEETRRFAGIIYNSQWLLSLAQNLTPNKTVLTPPTPTVSKKTTTGEQLGMLVGDIELKGVMLFSKIANLGGVYTYTLVQSGYGRSIELGGRAITYVPQTSDLKDYYLTAKNILVPSKAESWSMAASEAMAYGVRPVVFDDLPGVVENVGAAGVLMPRNSTPTSWKIALKKPYDPEEVKQQARQNRQTHLKQLKQTVKFLEQLVK